MTARVFIALGMVWLAGAYPPAVHAVLRVVAPTGDDSNVGSERAPLRTVTAAVRAALPGDVIAVAAGVYREAVAVAVAGAPEAPIVIRGLPGAVLESPDPSASLSAFDIRAESAHVRIEGFTLRGGFAETVFVRSGARSIELEGLHLYENHAGIWIAGATDVAVRDCVIERNARTGVRIFAGARRVRVADTRADGNDDGAGCSGDADGFSADESTADIVFERCKAAGNSEDGFDLQTPSVAVLASRALDNGCSGVKLAAGGTLENLVVERQRTGINIGAGGLAASILHCTLVGNDTGIRATRGDYALAVRNSVVTGPGKALSADATVRLDENHNIFHRPLAKDRLIEILLLSGSVLYSGNDVNSGRWQQASGQGEGTMAVDPLLDAATCVPAADSAAIDSAAAEGCPAVDVRGVTRPRGNAPERGAIEVEPEQAQISALRIAGRPDASGMGRVTVVGELALSPGPRLDPGRDALTVDVRGTGGRVLRVTADPSTEGARRATYDDDDGRPVRLRWVTDGVRLRFWLTASSADLWALRSEAAYVTVDVATVHVEDDVTVRLPR